MTNQAVSFVFMPKVFWFAFCIPLLVILAVVCFVISVDSYQTKRFRWIFGNLGAVAVILAFTVTSALDAMGADRVVYQDQHTTCRYTGQTTTVQCHDPSTNEWQCSYVLRSGDTGRPCQNQTRATA